MLAAVGGCVEALVADGAGSANSHLSDPKACVGDRGAALPLLALKSLAAAQLLVGDSKLDGNPMTTAQSKSENREVLPISSCAVAAHVGPGGLGPAGHPPDSSTLQPSGRRARTQVEPE